LAGIGAAGRTATRSAPSSLSGSAYGIEFLNTKASPLSAAADYIFQLPNVPELGAMSAGLLIDFSGSLKVPPYYPSCDVALSCITAGLLNLVSDGPMLGEGSLAVTVFL
jgi:hypothetical protein